MLSDSICRQHPSHWFPFPAVAVEEDFCSAMQTIPLRAFPADRPHPKLHCGSYPRPFSPTQGDRHQTWLKTKWLVGSSSPKRKKNCLWKVPFWGVFHPIAAEHVFLAEWFPSRCSSPFLCVHVHACELVRVYVCVCADSSCVLPPRSYKLLI